MKYLKHFEAVKEKSKFWIIDINQPHLNLALKYIGMDDDVADDYENMFMNKQDDLTDKFIIFRDKDKTTNDYYWSYCGINATNQEGIKYIDNTEYQNMGSVYITDDQATAEKYNL